MAILLMGDKEKADITRAIERARRKPITLAWLRQWGFAASEHKGPLKLADRKPGFPERPRSQQVLIPIGYRAAVSFEEQPAGMAMHLSISVERPDPKWNPSVAAVQTIAEAFGIAPDRMHDGEVWMEEYEPGRHAVNIVVIVTPTAEGHA